MAMKFQKKNKLVKELFTKKFELAPLGTSQTYLAKVSKEEVLAWAESKLDMTAIDDNIATDKSLE